MRHPPTGAWLARLVRAATAYPRLTIGIALALAFVGAGLSLRSLAFQTSSVQLLPPSHVYVQRFKDHLRDFGELNDIVIAIEAPSLARAQAYADRLAADIRRLPGASRVAYRVDPDLFEGKALLYLSTAELEELARKVRMHRPFIERYAAEPTVAGLLSGLGEEIARGLALGFLDLGLDGGPRATLDAGFVDTLLGVLEDALAGRGVDAAPWARVFTSSDHARSGYFVSADRRLLFVLVEPRRDATSFTDNERYLAGIRGRMQDLREPFPDVAAGATGTPALSNDEMLTAFRDSSVATLLAAVLTVGVLVGVMRRTLEPLVMLAVLLVSLLWSLGIITLTVGHLTVFSVMFISLLIGIGIDYGVYLFLRYEDEVQRGHAPRQALEVTAVRSGPGILFGALAAAGTFGVLVLTEFRGIQEFGVVAGIAILMAFAAMMTLYPAMLVVLPRRGRRPAPTAAGAADDVRWLRALERHAKPVVAGAAVLTVGALLVLPAVRFDYSRLSLQARGTESVVWERRIMETRRSGFAALATADSLRELETRHAAFSALPAVGELTSLLTLVPGDQEARIAAVRRMAPLLAGIHVRDDLAVDPDAVIHALVGLRHRLGIAAVEGEGHGAAATLRSAHARTAALLSRLERRDDRAAMARLAEVQARLREDFVANLRRFRENLDPRPITVEDLPSELTRKFVGASGRLLMLIYPAIDTWERDGAREFVRQLRSVDAAVTGSPVISDEASRLVETAYVQGTLYAIVLVLALAAVLLRRPRDIGLALPPLLLGTLWTIGGMRLFGMDFNLANVWGVPLLIGASAEYGFNVVLRYRERPGGPVRFPRSAMLAVALNGLTTMTGFGSLLVARHQGIFGLGVLLTIGTAAALAASLVVLPALLHLVEREDAR